MCLCSKKRLTTLQALLAKGQPAAEGKSLVPLCLLRPVLGSPAQERHRHTEASPVEGCQDVGWLELVKERLRELCLFSPKERWLQGEAPCCMQLLRGGCREDGARLLSEMHSGRTRGSKDELEHEKFWLDTVIYFSLWGWSNTGASRLPREAAVSSTLGDTQNQPAWGPEQPALPWPALSRELEEVNSGGPFPAVWFHVAARYSGAVSERKS